MFSENFPEEEMSQRKDEPFQRKDESFQRILDRIRKNIAETKLELEKVSKSKADLSDTEGYLRRKICDLEVKLERLSHKSFIE